MVKILVNAPKGGVGKTTLSTNIALFLAENGHKIWALDLAQGTQMTKFLKLKDFEQNGNKIDTKELQSLPTSFPGKKNFDYLVVDTDDYYKILTDLVKDPKANQWKIIVPILNDYTSLDRITDEVASIMTARMLQGTPRLDLKIIGNKIDNKVIDIPEIETSLQNSGIQTLLSFKYISHSPEKGPFFNSDPIFHKEINDILKEIGVI
jgi:chromosome partitioning protein